jgi:hypothetical protein
MTYYECPNGCGMVSTSDVYPCPKCGTPYIEAIPYGGKSNG